MSGQQPKKVVREALVRFFDAVDTDFDGFITADDLVDFCRARNVNLPEETARAMFADAKRRRWHNGLSPLHLSPRDVACAVSSRRVPGKAWTSWPFREQWIYLVGAVVPADAVFERPGVAPVRPAAPMTGKELFASLSRNSPRRPHTSGGASSASSSSRLRVRAAPPRRNPLRRPAPYESPRAADVVGINATMTPSSAGAAETAAASCTGPASGWGWAGAEMASASTSSSSSSSSSSCGGGGGTRAAAAAPTAAAAAAAAAAAGPPSPSQLLVTKRESPTCGFEAQAFYNNFGQKLQNDAEQAMRASQSAGRLSPGTYELLLQKTLTGIPSPSSPGRSTSPARFVHQIPTRDMLPPHDGRPISAIGHIRPSAPLERLFESDRSKAREEADNGYPMRERGWTQPVGYGRVPTLTEQKNDAAKNQPNFFGEPADYSEGEYVTYDRVAERATCRPRARRGQDDMRHSFMGDWTSENWTKEVEPRKISKLDLKPAAVASAHLLDRTGRFQYFDKHLRKRAVPRQGDWLRQSDSAIQDVNDSPLLDSASLRMRQEEQEEKRHRRLVASGQEV